MEKNIKSKPIQLPMISVVTVVFNSASTIEKTIISIINQTYKNFEYIVIDGGSSDGTINVINKYRDKINCIISEKDEGISDAFNKGVRNSSGDWIIFINSGDTFIADSILDKVHSHLLQTDFDVIYGKINLVNTYNCTQLICGKPFDRKTFLKRMNIPHQATFHNKNLYLKYGFYSTDYRIAMDYDLLLRVKDLKVLFINEVISNMSAGGVSQIYPIKTFREFTKAKLTNLKNKSHLMIKYEYCFMVMKQGLKQVMVCLKLIKG
ncbi:MAG: glycosyltransferase family 2 protein [Candidatus Wallbacteria bacterium]|nr:glycosyltransferase family 2 protein [Candidatus Wallbacteria bacterium]